MPSSTTNPPTSPTSPTPQTPTDLLTHLHNTNAFEDLHGTLLSTLQRMGWTEKIRKLALELLRAGRCERFDEVVDAVIATAQGRKDIILDPGNRNGKGGDAETEAYFEDVDVRIPRVVVEQGVRALKEVLGEVVVLEGEGEDETGTGVDVGPGNGTGTAEEDGKTGEKNAGPSNGGPPKSKKPGKGAK